MNFKNLGQLPIIITSSVFLSTLFSESRIHVLIPESRFFKTFMRFSDPKTLTFFVLTTCFLLTSTFIEIFKFISTNKSTIKNLKTIKKNLELHHSLIFAVIINGYIMKVNERQLYKFSLTLAFLYINLIISTLVHARFLVFMMNISLFYVMGLIMCFSYLRNFSVFYDGMVRSLKFYVHY